jgi:hypothetical protein
MTNLPSAIGPGTDFLGDPTLLGSGVNLDTTHRLQKAVTARRKSRFEAERLLWEARAEDPACLPVYQALYNFYAHAFRLKDAMRVTRLAMAEAARQGGFSPDWEKLNLESDGSAHVDLYASEAGRFYLIALRSLALLCLRQKKFDDAATVIDHLMRLDRENRLGKLSIDSIAAFASATPPAEDHG